jgi:hypothetical protein
MTTTDVIKQYFIKSIDVIDVIVGRYNQYFLTSIVIIAVIVGSYNHFLITSIIEQ